MKKLFIIFLVITGLLVFPAQNNSDNLYRDQYLDFEDTNLPEYVKG
ncbi:MAG: hypothetical protein QM489_05880 [Candidatus Izemoplasma sp.]